MCESLALYGYSGWDGGGGMSEYVALPPKSVHVIPDSMNLDVAALVERESSHTRLAYRQPMVTVAVPLLVRVAEIT